MANLNYGKVGMTVQTNYRLYAKFPGQKTFKAVNWKSGQQVGNLIYASFFTEEERNEVQKSLDLPENSSVKFEWRKACGPQ